MSASATALAARDGGRRDIEGVETSKRRRDKNDGAGFNTRMNIGIVSAQKSNAGATVCLLSELLLALHGSRQKKRSST